MRQPAPTSAGEVPETPARGGANHGHAALSGVVVGVSGGLFKEGALVSGSR